jgi:putative thiamine transport system permease protein
MEAGRPDVQDWLGRLVAALALFAAFLVLFVSVAAAVLGTFLSPAEGPFSSLRTVLNSPGILRSILLSLWVGLASTALAYGGALALAAAFSTGKGKGEKVMTFFLATPHTAVALAIGFLIAPSGFLARLLAAPFGWEAPPQIVLPGDPYGLSLILGLTAKELPFLFIMAISAVRSLPPSLPEMSASLGYPPLRGWLATSLPLVHRQTKIAAMIAFVYAAGSSEQALILGPTIGAPLPVRLLDWFREPDLDAQSKLAAGSLVLLFTVLAGLFVWSGFLFVFERIALIRTKEGRRTGFSEVLARSAQLGGLLLLGSAGFGLLVLSASSFSGPWAFPDILPGRWSTALWQQQGEQLRSTAALTVGLAAAATILACLWTLCALEAVRGRRAASRWLAAGLLALLLIPEPSVMFGLGVALSRTGANGGIGGVLFLHIVAITPYTFLLLRAADAAFTPEIFDAARSLGAGAFRTFYRIRLPLLVPALTTALFLGAIISVGLYLPTLAGGAGRVASLVTEGVAAASGDRRVAGALALLLTALPLVMLAAGRAAAVLGLRRSRVA